ncbi:MAG TPA: sigma-54 dependent transcriptional regulator [Gemmatimonadaceae bacterium]|jgi:DNA-binding NtrC family response regulator|nr:sigma-54 dependent transcriptional regulator [Gemmatimonadaceae bacterium]
MREDAMIKVLVAEDEPHLGALLEKFLSGRGYQVTTRTDGRAALDALRAESFDVALLDIVMPEMDGLEVLRQVREETSPPEVIIITGNGTVETAISAMKLGAYDYLSKPYRMAEIDVLVRRAWEKRQLARENTLLQTRLSRLNEAPEIITQHAPMQAVLSLIERVARSDSSVLVSGEPGTGKDLVAHTLHRLSHRASGPLVDINCAAIPDALLESELFGHEKGAFPGASSRKLGLFELASGGTMFMDEIGELDVKVQGKLLRALELGAFYRVGGTQKVFADVRVVAASAQDLASRVADGSFRAELYYRINTISITLPPLRERAVDIPPLARHFLGVFGGAQAPALSEEALEALQGYHWPGNVRELRNVIERAVLLASNGVIRVSDLPALRAPQRAPARGPDLEISLEELERRHIDAVLRAVSWHQGRAADILGISPKTLYRKIREYGFRRPSETASHGRAQGVSPATP